MPAPLQKEGRDDIAKRVERVLYDLRFLDSEEKLRDWPQHDRLSIFADLEMIKELAAPLQKDGGEGHRVDLEFDGFGPSVKLLHPEGGCPLPEGVCEDCGADLQDPESKRCKACAGMRPGWCWIEDWVENEGHELLHGKVTLPVESEWDGDSARLHVQQPPAFTQPASAGEQEPRTEYRVVGDQPKSGGKVGVQLVVVKSDIDQIRADLRAYRDESSYADVRVQQRTVSETDWSDVDV